MSGSYDNTLTSIATTLREEKGPHYCEERQKGSTDMGQRLGVLTELYTACPNLLNRSSSCFPPVEFLTLVLAKPKSLVRNLRIISILNRAYDYVDSSVWKMVRLFQSLMGYRLKRARGDPRRRFSWKPSSSPLKQQLTL